MSVFASNAGLTHKLPQYNNNCLLEARYHLNAVLILKKHFAASPEAFHIVLEHSRMVAAKALAIASAIPDPSLDLRLLEEAALLHDIGVSRIHAPRIGCHGDHPYICHGVLGREILETEGLPVHAMVCERHIGVGLGVKDIVQQRLPLPKRDMVPVTLAERIICFADLFYSKRPGSLDREKSPDDIRTAMLRHGSHKVAIFERWVQEFSR